MANDRQYKLGIVRDNGDFVRYDTDCQNAFWEYKLGLRESQYYEYKFRSEHGATHTSTLDFNAMKQTNLRHNTSRNMVLGKHSGEALGIVRSTGEFKRYDTDCQDAYRAYKRGVRGRYYEYQFVGAYGATHNSRLDFKRMKQRNLRHGTSRTMSVRQTYILKSSVDIQV